MSSLRATTCIYPAVIVLSSDFTNDAATVSKSTTTGVNMRAERGDHVCDVQTTTTNSPMRFKQSLMPNHGNNIK